MSLNARVAGLLYMAPTKLRQCVLMLVVSWGLLGCRALFPTEAGQELSHFAAEAPSVGVVAPDVTLYATSGEEVRLADVLDGKPTVLLLGSHTCPVFRYRRHDVEPLKTLFRDRVKFITVYTLEAHPRGSASPYRDEEWIPFINRLTGVDLTQPQTLSERLQQAGDSARTLKLTGLVFVDAMTNRAWRAYGQAPSPAFVLDGEGRVVLRQVWVEPKQIREVLERLVRS